MVISFAMYVFGMSYSNKCERRLCSNQHVESVIKSYNLVDSLLSNEVLSPHRNSNEQESDVHHSFQSGDDERNDATPPLACKWLA